MEVLDHQDDLLTKCTGWTVLHIVAGERISNLETIKKLISMGLDRNQKNISGETPYDIAVRWQRDSDIIEALK